MLTDGGEPNEIARLDVVVSDHRQVIRDMEPEILGGREHTQGLGIAASREVQHLTRDALGLPRLDDVFFALE